jgi:flagellin-like hook-associated protein FlgL
MTGIVLSAAVRQNLLSLQSTAALLATTQNDLSTGNKVNSALDNPTSYFTAAALTDRAGDISNLLDGIGNGVQVLQAANTGITSLQSLVASAQSVANQVLQTPVGYDSKSSVSTPPISGANVNNLLGTGAGYTDATFAGATATGTVTTAFTNAAATGTAVNNDDTTVAPISTATLLVGTAGTTSNDLATAITDGSTLVVNGKTITFSTATTSSTGSASSGFTIGIGTGSTASVATILSDIDAITGTTPASSVTSGKLVLQTGTTANLTITGSGNALAELGLSSGVTQARTGGVASTTALVGTALLSGTTASTVGALSTGFTAGDTLTVDGKTLTFVTGAAGANQISTTGTVASLLAAIDTASGSATASSVAGGAVVLHTGTVNSTLSIASNNTAALAALGLTGGVSQAATGTSPTLTGKTLLIAATGGGTATSITFGTGSGQVSSLNQLNTALAGNNLQATIDPTGIITLTTSNNAASSTIGAITGTSTVAGQAFTGLAGLAPVVDPNAQATRTGLIAQYNNILQQIDTTSQDSSFNGINLLEGDTLNLTFDETGKSTLAIQGVTFNTAGLGLSTLAVGTDFLDSSSANKVLSSLSNVSTTLRSEASNLGSNLSIVQIRQDFSKNLINVLQTGASNLTLADTNEEAANSQALSTRQSIAVSALALANQSQQSVLQLLR